MQLPQQSSSPGTLARFGKYTMARVLSHSRAKDLVLLVRAPQADLKAKQAAYIQADDDLLEAQASCDGVQFRAEEELTALQLDAVVVVARNYSDPRYTALFPKGLTHLRRLSRGEMQGEVPRVLAVLKQEGTDARLTAHAPALEQIELDWAAQQKQLGLATLAMTLAHNGVEAAKVAWLDAFAKLYGALLAQFPRQRTLVESFFPKNRGKKKVKDAPVPQPVPA